jgi:hypothetical protein
MPGGRGVRERDAKKTKKCMKFEFMIPWMIDDGIYGLPLVNLIIAWFGWNF